MNRKSKGISLIVLVITIIVMIIIAAAIILSITNNNVIAKAKEAKAKNDISIIKEKWQRAYSETLIDTGGALPTEEQIAGNFVDVPIGYEITQTGIRYVGGDAVIRDAAIALGIEIYTDEKYFQILFDGSVFVKPPYFDEITMEYSIPHIISIPPTINGEAVTSIGTNAFLADTDLTSITIPSSVTEIGDWAFSECQNLTSITIPNSVTAIGDGAFSYCSSLTSITMPSGITTIDISIFRSCTNLTSITIPSSVTLIGTNAFYDCGSLASIIIPSSVTTIGTNAFYGCQSLASIKIQKVTNSILGTSWGATCPVLWNP